MTFGNNIITEQTSFIKKFLFLILVLFMGKGCNFFIDLDPRVNIVGTLLVLVPMVHVMLREKPHSMKNSKFYVFLLAYIAWLVYHIFTDEAYPTYQGIRILSLFIFGFITARYYGCHIAEYFEYFVVRLTILALILWSVEVAIGPATMGGFAPFENRMHIYCKSFGLFSVVTKFDPSEYFLGIPRNSGFCWEAGQFASMIVLALTFHLLRTKEKIYKNKSFWILLAGLITTFSTTGFVSFGVLLLFKTVFGKVSFGKRIAYIAVLGTLYMYAMDLPFMREKMEDQSDITEFYTNSDNVWIDETGQRTVQRFEGMYLSWMNFMDSPWLGFGPNRDNSLVSKQFPMFIISNGNINPLAMLGLLLGLPLFILFYRGSCRLNQYLGDDKKYIIFMIFIFFSVSYNYLFDIIPLAIAFLSFDNQYEKEIC